MTGAMNCGMIFMYRMFLIHGVIGLQRSKRNGNVYMVKPGVHPDNWEKSSYPPDNYYMDNFYNDQTYTRC